MENAEVYKDTHTHTHYNTEWILLCVEWLLEAGNQAGIRWLDAQTSSIIAEYADTHWFCVCV